MAQIIHLFPSVIDAATIDRMRMYGGSFVRSLAECFATADKTNKEILIKGFQNYIDEYGPKGRFANKYSIKVTKS
tara:strand:+ start:508 stop:732 length:225 start_codon:yes stop_codon:yes gene_type:complete